MARIITRKIALIITALIIGGGAIAFAMTSQPQQQSTANAAPSGVEDVVASDVGFLNYDMVLGDRDAPVEIIEYAAISCSHCAHFHSDVMPDLKKKYLDTGKVRLIYRNFIFNDPFDVYASTLTRCVSEENFFPTVKTFFDYQKVWHKREQLPQVFETGGRDAVIKFAQDEVTRIAGMSGISPAEAKSCFENEGVISYLLQIRQEAVEKHGVNSTPTLIVNGRKIAGHEMADIDRAIAEALKP